MSHDVWLADARDLLTAPLAVDTMGMRTATAHLSRLGFQRYAPSLSGSSKAGAY